MQILTLAIAHRQKIIEDVDGAPSKTIDLTGANSDNESDVDVDAMLGRRAPSGEAMAKINDYRKLYSVEPSGLRCLTNSQ